MALQFFEVLPNPLGAWVPYLIKEHLKSCGWSTRASGDGTSYFAAGDGITHGGSGAGGFGNTRAWAWLRSPDAAVHATLQRVNNDTLWRVKIAISDLNAGSPSATETPAPAVAANEFVLLGGGTDAAPSGSNWFSGADGGLMIKGAADDAAPYGFWFASGPACGVASSGLAQFILDPLQYAIAGDAFPYVAIARVNDLTQSILSPDATTNQIGYVASAAPSVSAAMPLLYLGPATSFSIPRDVPGASGGRARLFPARYERRAAIANPGYKGVSTMMRWIAPTLGRWTPLSVESNYDWLVYGDVALPWSGEAPRY